MSDAARLGHIARQSALATFNIMDTEAEQSFDEIAKLAAQICATPTALISLVEPTRQWFKARVGFPESETPISQSVCAFALDSEDLFIIPDLASDPRTARNTLVTGAPFIRFYAGAPLRSDDGVAIGTLCVIDTEPRRAGLTDTQAAALRTLSHQVMALLRLRSALHQRDTALDRQRVIELELREDAARHDALFVLQRQIETAVDVSDVLQRLVEGCLKLVPAATGAVAQFRSGDELIYRSASGQMTRHLEYRLPIGLSLSGLSLTEGRALKTDDALNDTRIDPALATELDLRSVIVVPIARRGEFIGVLKVGSSLTEAFVDRDVQTVQLLAAAAAAGLAEVGEAEALKDVQTSEARYRAIFEGAVQFAVVVLDRAGHITSWNAGAQSLLGWTAAEIAGSHVRLLFTDRDRASEQPELELQQAELTGHVEDERWHVRNDGTLLWASCEMLALRSEDGTPVGFVKMLRDRTAQRDAEEGLRRNEERLAFAFDAAGAAGWWDWDIREDRVFANSRFAEFFHVGPERAAAGAPLESFLHAVHPEDRAELALSINRAMKEGGAFTSEYRLVDGSGAVRWVFARGACYHDAAGQPLRFPGVLIDITERKEAERFQAALLALGDRLRNATTQAEITQAFGSTCGEALSIVRAGFAAFNIAAGVADVEGDWCAPNVPTISGGHKADAYGTFFDDLKLGQLVAISDVEADPRSSAQSANLLRLDIRALVNVPIVERGELVTVFFVHDINVRAWQTRETTFIREAADRTRAELARMLAEERQTILNQELSHRMKNTLAMVQGIATQTMRNAVNLESARDTLASRLMVFGRAHDILLADSAEGAGLAEVMQAALASHDDGMPGRIVFHGPDLPIGRRAALSFALMMHELATNAVKYGSLSRTGGHVDLSWQVDGSAADPELQLEWREAGGPEVKPPNRKGFGSRLIERGLAGSLGGQVSLTYAPEGLVCRVTASVKALRQS